MHKYCHRCGGDLPAGSGESPFCPHCGAPQLSLSLDYQSAETGGDVGAASSGMQPPPRPQQIDWRTAIGCAAAVAGVAAVLAVGSTRVAFLSPLSFGWIAFASAITLGIYQRRLPAAWMDVAVGARIGVVVGILLSVGLGLAMAVSGLAARFWLHRMGAYDVQMAEQISNLQKAMAQQAATQQAGSTLPAEVLGLIHSPEFAAGMMLSGAALMAGFLVILCTLGGAFAGMVGMRRRVV